ncbi:MAG TPA: signal peptidase I [Frankiaceae bacterium]|jgi:signal peptidase I|nr:signal peptidase I [Frankiaceae bacterium]
MTTDTSLLVDDEDVEGSRPPVTRGLWFLGLVAVALALFMKTFLVQAFFIPSGSMEQTLHGCPGCSGDRVLVNKVVYKFRPIHRGEIVVFNGKNTNFVNEGSVEPPRNVAERVLRGVQGLIGFGAPGEKDFIKRVIGVPGDVVACCDTTLKDDEGNVVNRITINGQVIDEPYVYLSDETTPQAVFEPVTVPEGRLFVMGDHRDGSSDSRYNGTIPESAVVGRAFAVFYPFERRKVLRVPDVFDPTKRRASEESLPPAGDPVLGVVLVPLVGVRRRVRSDGLVTT